MSIGDQSGAIPVAIGMTYIVLVLFGVLYNQFVTSMIRKKHADGLMGFAVAFGVTITLLAARLIMEFIRWDMLIITLTAFAASGSPMIVGSITRRWESEDHALDDYRTGGMQ